MSPTPPTTLGKYQIIREIARSNDIVYEAYDPLMNRRVALKELAVPSGSTSQQREDRIKRFLREARAAGSLAHPGIMTVYEVGEDAGRYFIAMEFLEGKTLRNELDLKGFLPYERAIAICDAVLDALDYAHAKGVIHRDIKPDNIQLLPDGGVKLTDFGIARLTFEPNLTIDGQVFGTPSYMSPEQVVGRDLDARSDLFSVGVVLYEMLSGVKPFAGDSVVTITYAIMNKQPDRPQQVNYALWPVIERALDKSPQLRYRDAAEMKAAIGAAIAASQNVVIDPVLPAQPSTVVPQFGVGGPTGQPVYMGAAFPPQAPIYYVAPKPRRKWLSAKAKAALTQLFAIFVAIAAILGVSYVFIEQLSNRVATDVQRSIEQGLEKRAPAAPSAEPQAAGVALWKAGKHREAEVALRQAIEAYPNDPRPFRAHGQLQADRASRTTDLELELQLSLQAAESLETSGRLERDENLASSDRIESARARLRYARVLIERRRSSEAFEHLSRALTLAREDSQLSEEIRRLRDQAHR